MIDIESKVYTPVAQALRNAGATVKGVYVNAPTSFPFVSIIESDNYSAEMDNSDTEKFAVVMYEVNIYSNNANRKKSECKNLMAICSDAFYKMNFTRISCLTVPNLEDASIYRMTARFRALTDGEYIYRR